MAADTRAYPTPRQSYINHGGVPFGECVSLPVRVSFTLRSPSADRPFRETMSLWSLRKYTRTVYYGYLYCINNYEKVIICVRTSGNQGHKTSHKLGKWP